MIMCAFIIVLRLVFCVYLKITATFESLVEHPRNAVAIVGDKVELACSTNGVANVRWYMNERSYIYVGYVMKDFRRHNVSEEGPQRGHLIIYPVQTNDAAIYKCTDSEGDLALAELVVVVNVTQCWTNLSSFGYTLESEVVEFVCSINYTGNWDPVIKWQQLDPQGQPQHNVSGTERHINYTTWKSVVHSLAVQTTADLSGVKYRSVTYFDRAMKPNTRPNSATATNVPLINYTWTSPVLRIAYGPLSAVTRLSSSHQTRVECSADGDPTPTYHWEIVIDNQTTIRQGHELDLSTITPSRSIQLSCVATNKVSGRKKTAGHFHLADMSLCANRGISLHWPVVVSAIAVGSFLLILTAVNVVKRTGLRKRGRPTERHQRCPHDSENYMQHQDGEDPVNEENVSQYEKLTPSAGISAQQQVYAALDHRMGMTESVDVCSND